MLCRNSSLLWFLRKCWNITKDWSFDRKDTPDEDLDSGGADLRILLVYYPPPRDLPAISKDMLILHAAFSGNIDRYTTLCQQKLYLEREDGILLVTQQIMVIGFSQLLCL